MRRTQRSAHEPIDDLIAKHYCVYGADGRKDEARVEVVRKALGAANRDADAGGEVSLPDVPGVPHLHTLIDDPTQIPVVVRELLPRVQADPRLHALSFTDPIRLATDELGVALSPRVARIARRALASAVSFDPARSLDPQGRGQGGLVRIQWRPKGQ
jgi:hypothetical protein